MDTAGAPPPRSAADADAGHRAVTLPYGGTLVVRPASADDVDGLLAMYAGLSVEDLYHRFFSAFHPSRAFLLDWIATTARDGMDLVAVVSDDVDRVVGECGYVLLPDGDGELAITVASDWRGWLGAYLLDVLMDVASSRGVPNLQADILLENRGMLALARSRGCATLDHADWSSVRLTMSTTGSVPRWPGHHETPQVLVEIPGERWRAAEQARAAGLRVVACAGPGAMGAVRCPALDGEPCPLAAGADVIVVAPRADGGPASALLEAHRRLHPHASLAVDTATSDTTPLPDGVVRLPDDGDVAEAVRQLVRGDGDRRDAPLRRTTD